MSTADAQLFPCATACVSAPASSRIAVLIPVYNDDGQLQATLRSLRAQTIAFTAVIVDDGSVPALHLDTANLGFPVILLRLAQNMGIERALNAGLGYILAHGFEYVARLDNGDICAVNRLAQQAVFLDDHAEVGLVGSQVEWRRDDGSLAFRPELPCTHEAIIRALHHTVCLIHPTVMFRTDVIRQVGYYSYAFPAAEDYELFWRIARGYRVANIPELLLTTRFDRRGISMRKRRRQLRSKLKIQLTYFRATEPLSYVGLLKTFALMCIPYSIIVKIKRHLSGGSVAATT